MVLKLQGLGVVCLCPYSCAGAFADSYGCAVERPREQAEESDAFCFVSGKGAEMAKAMGLAGQVMQPVYFELEPLMQCGTA